MPVKDKLDDLRALARLAASEENLETVRRVAVSTGRRTLGLSLSAASAGLSKAVRLVQGLTPGADSGPGAKADAPAEVVGGAVGSLNDNSDVPADGAHAPFPGYDKLSGDSVMRHVAASSDVPDLRVLLAYEQAHKARKGVVSAVTARLKELGESV